MDRKIVKTYLNFALRRFAEAEANGELTTEEIRVKKSISDALQGMVEIEVQHQKRLQRSRLQLLPEIKKKA
jgi:hypothetical protein